MVWQGIDDNIIRSYMQSLQGRPVLTGSKTFLDTFIVKLQPPRQAKRGATQREFYHEILEIISKHMQDTSAKKDILSVHLYQQFLKEGRFGQCEASLLLTEFIVRFTPYNGTLKQGINTGFWEGLANIPGFFKEQPATEKGTLSLEQRNLKAEENVYQVLLALISTIYHSTTAVRLENFLRNAILYHKKGLSGKSAESEKAKADILKEFYKVLSGVRSIRYLRRDQKHVEEDIDSLLINGVRARKEEKQPAGLSMVGAALKGLTESVEIQSFRNNTFNYLRTLLYIPGSTQKFFQTYSLPLAGVVGVSSQVDRIVEKCKELGKAGAKKAYIEKLIEEGEDGLFGQWESAIILLAHPDYAKDFEGLNSVTEAFWKKIPPHLMFPTEMAILFRVYKESSSEYIQLFLIDVAQGLEEFYKDNKQKANTFDQFMEDTTNPMDIIRLRRDRDSVVEKKIASILKTMAKKELLAK